MDPVSARIDGGRRGGSARILHLATMLLGLLLNRCGEVIILVAVHLLSVAGGITAWPSNHADGPNCHVRPVRLQSMQRLSRRLESWREHVIKRILIVH